MPWLPFTLVLVVAALVAALYFFWSRRTVASALDRSRAESQALKDYLDRMSTLCAHLDLDGRVIRANRACLQALGLPEGDPVRTSVMESPWLRFDPDAAKRMRAFFEEARKGQVIHRDETLLVGDRLVYEQFTLNPLRDAAGKVTGVLLEGRNVTDLKDAQAALYEINERLYSGEDLGRVGFADYLRDLAGQLVRSSDVAGGGVQLDLDLEEMHLALSQAIPGGLAVHELVANALKHAFPADRIPAGRLCRVSIRSRNLPDGGFELEVEDNGAGLPRGFEIVKSKSLGLQLVRTLVKQLQGTLEIGTGPGTRFRIAAPAA